jgi:hypothetical protein
VLQEVPVSIRVTVAHAPAECPPNIGNGTLLLMQGFQRIDNWEEDNAEDLGPSVACDCHVHWSRPGHGHEAYA